MDSKSISIILIFIFILTLYPLKGYDLKTYADERTFFSDESLRNILASNSPNYSDAPLFPDYSRYFYGKSPNETAHDVSTEFYSAKIYKNNGEIISEDKEHNIISRGRSGIDDAAVIKQTIDYINAGKIIFNGTFFITSTIDNLKSNLILEGYPEPAIIDATNTECDIFSVGEWGYSPSTISLIEDSSAGSQVISVNNASVLQPNDWVKLIDNENINGYKRGEILRIKKISGDEIILWDNVSENYKVSQDAFLRKLTPCENITIKGFKVIGPGPETVPVLIKGYILRNFIFESNYIYLFGRAAVHLVDSMDSRISDNRFEDIYMKGLGYSIEMTNACQNITIENNLFEKRGRHYIALGGETGTGLSGGFGRNIKILDNYFEASTEEAINTHAPFKGPINIEQNNFSYCNKGIELFDGYSMIANNNFRNCDIGIRILNYQKDKHQISENTFEQCRINLML